MKEITWEERLEKQNLLGSLLLSAYASIIYYDKFILKEMENSFLEHYKDIDKMNKVKAEIIFPIFDKLTLKEIIIIYFNLAMFNKIFSTDEYSYSRLIYNDKELKNKFKISRPNNISLLEENHFFKGDVFGANKGFEISVLPYITNAVFNKINLFIKSLMGEEYLKFFDTLSHNYLNTLIIEKNIEEFLARENFGKNIKESKFLKSALDLHKTVFCTKNNEDLEKITVLKDILNNKENEYNKDFYFAKKNWIDFSGYFTFLPKK